jgi:hypothetical protein
VVTDGVVTTEGAEGLGSRVGLFAAIRRDARVEGCSIRELADRYHVHRRTVRQALASAIPPPRKTPARTSLRLAPFKAAIDEMLRSDLAAPKKQRHTARRVLARLVDEHGAKNLSYSTVRDYVARRRLEIAAEAGKPLEAGYVPQTHLPAAEAEVDFHGGRLPGSLHPRVKAGERARRSRRRQTAVQDHRPLRPRRPALPG